MHVTWKAIFQHALKKVYVKKYISKNLYSKSLYRKLLKKVLAFPHKFLYNDTRFMDGFPSGQRGQTVNLLATPSKVRILLHPLRK